MTRTVNESSHHCVRCAMWLAAVVAFACTLAAGAGQSAKKEVVVLESQAFEEDLTGWNRQGQAEFAADKRQEREGHLSARIIVRPGTPLTYQQLRRDFTEDLLPGDEFRATVWVRTADISADPGAYLALEFVGDGDARVGIAHSKTGAANGKDGWDKLEATGRAPEGTRTMRMSLVLHAYGTAWFADPEIVRTDREASWPDLGDTRREIRLHTNEVVHPKFGGVGFHAFHHVFPTSQKDCDQVIYKRWRELNPSFARLNGNFGWDNAKLDEVARHLQQMKETGTEVYVATWDPPDTEPGVERAAYAKKVVDQLEYFIRDKGLTNIRYYCMTNELSLRGWGKLAGDLPKFKDYHQALHEELKARKLDIGLLATDASPVEWWWTIEWATKNMDSITALYGGHHYINDRPLDDERFYPWFLSKMEWGAGMARAKGKNFILGEFGSKQDGRTLKGVRMDRCVYFETPQEPMVAIQLAEAAIAAMNGGVYAMGYWTFMDCPDEGFGKSYQNKWGLFKCSGPTASGGGEDRSTRALYYGYGLLTKFFRGPATVFKTEVNDPRLRVAAVQHHGRGTWSIAIVNRNKREVPVSIALDGKPITATLRKYVYNPAQVPQHPFGDLQAPMGNVAMKQGRLTDTVGAGTLTVYTTAYDDRPPAPVKGLKTQKASEGKARLEWQANTEPDLCYYRVYRSEKASYTPDVSSQIGSTIATGFVDESPAGTGSYHYKVVAVDQSGNTSALPK